MIISWVKQFQTEEEKQNFERQFHNAADVLETLDKIIQDELTALDASEVSQRNYDNSNWAYLQAHKNGFRQAMGIIRKLINLDQ